MISCGREVLVFIKHLLPDRNISQIRKIDVPQNLKNAKNCNVK